MTNHTSTRIFFISFNLPPPLLNYRLAKWGQGKFSQLEMLPAKRYADNGDRQQYAENQVHHRGIQSPRNNPDNIAQQRKASAVIGRGYHFFAKGPEYQPGYFKALHAKRQPNNGKAKDKPAKHIAQRCSKAAKYQPDKIPDQVHVTNIYWSIIVGR